MGKQLTIEQRLEVLQTLITGMNYRIDALTKGLEKVVPIADARSKQQAAKAKPKAEGTEIAPPKAEAKPKTKRIVTPEQKAKLAAAREAWFQKKGYGKFKKEEPTKEQVLEQISAALK
jgi:hypothetical protein